MAPFANGLWCHISVPLFPNTETLSFLSETMEKMNFSLRPLLERAEMAKLVRLPVIMSNF